MATRDVGNLRTRLSIDDQGTTRSLSRLKEDLRGLRSEMRTVTSQGRDYTSSLKGLRQQQDILNRQMRVHRERVQELNRRYREAVKVKGEDSKEARSLTRQLNNVTSQMNKTQQQLDKVTNAIEEQVNPWRRLGREAQEAGEKMQSVGQSLSSFGRDYSMKVTAPIVASGTAMFKAAMDFESSWASVTKTVDGSAAQMEELKTGIREMAKEIPASADAIAEVAANAGQLGIQTDNVLDFTRVMIDLGESTNLSAEQASMELSRLANITQMSQEDFDKLGSSLVALGNNFSTTEAEISSMALRLAAQGSQVGMSEAQILALAASMSSLGIEAEAGGSAISTVLKRIQTAVDEGGEALEGFASAAGVSAEEFANVWEKDAIAALDLFIKGLAQSSEQGENLTTILNDLGIKGIRESDTILRLAGASDILSDAVETSTKAWKENTALTNEANQRYETTESKLRIMWNRIKDVAITTGEALVPAVMDAIDAAEPLIKRIEEGAQAFADMSREEQETILKMIGLVAAVGPASIALGGLANTIGGVLKVGGSLSSLLGKASSGGGKGSGLLGGLSLLGPAKFTPVGLAIAGVGALGFALANTRKDTEELKDVSFEAAESMLSQYDTNQQLIDSFDELRKNSGLTNQEFARYVDLQSELESASDPKVIEAIKNEMAELEQKSGYSNEELSEMVKLNNDLVEALPGATGQISEQGNKIAGATEQAQKYNEELLKMATLEMEKQFHNALQNQSILLQTQVEQRKQLNYLAEQESLFEDLIADYSEDKLKNVREELAQETAKLQQQLAIGDLRGEELENVKSQIKLNEELISALRGGKDELKEQLLTIKEQKLEQEIQLGNTEQQIAQFDQITDRLLQHYLTTAGITEEKARQAIQDDNALGVLNERIRRLKEEKRQLIEQTPINERNTQEFKNGIAAIDEQIEELQNAKGNVKDLIELAGQYNDELSQNIDKNLNLRTQPTIRELNQELSSPVWRYVNLRYNREPMPLPTYAAGVEHNPGGMALVGGAE